MKMRIFCAVLTVVLVLTMLPVGIGAETTSEASPRIEFQHDVYYTEDGTPDRVDVVVYLRDNPGLVTATIPVLWDTSVLKLTNVARNDSIITSGWVGMDISEQHQEDGVYYLAWDNDTTIKSEAGQFTNGELVTLQFGFVDTTATDTWVKVDNTDLNIANIMSFGMEDYWSENVCASLAIKVEQNAGEEEPDEPVVDPDAPQIYIEDSEGKVGETVKVKIAIKNSPGITAALIKLSYDTDVFTLAEGTTANKSINSDLYGSKNLNNSDGTIRMAWVDSEVNYEGDFEFATLTFNVVDDPNVVGEYVFDLEYEMNSTYKIDNTTGSRTPIEFSIIDGIVEVNKYKIADANGDGSIDLQDAGIIMRYCVKLPNDIQILEAMDVDGSGTIDLQDAGIIMRYCVGLPIDVELG